MSKKSKTMLGCPNCKSVDLYAHQVANVRKPVHVMRDTDDEYLYLDLKNRFGALVIDEVEENDDDPQFYCPACDNNIDGDDLVEVTP